KMRGDLTFDKQFGIDLARFGGDESIIYCRSGMAVVEWKRLVKTEPLAVLDAAMEMQRRRGWKNEECQYIVDCVGIGEGAVAHLSRHQKRVHEFKSQHTSSKPDYANKITEAWFQLAKHARARRLTIPDDHVLVQQLSSRFYSTDNKGKLLLEKKADYMKRGYSSPDRADALAMAFYDAGRMRVSIA